MSATASLAYAAAAKDVIAEKNAEIERLRVTLGHARAAIASLDELALGGHEPNTPEDEPYSFRDALLHEIDIALNPSK